MRLLLSATCLLVLATQVHAQNQCRFYLANQTDGNSGFLLTLDATADANGKCQLSSINLRLSVGDGTALHHVDASFPWQMGTAFTAKAVMTAAGPHPLSINGQAAGSAKGAFVPWQGTLSASSIADSGTPTETYIVSQLSLQIANGSNNLSVAPNGGNPLPIPLILLAGGPAVWQAPFTENSAQTTTVTATFRFDPTVANLHQYDPYIDTYGQAIQAAWPGKITSDSDLQAAAAQEQTWLANNSPPAGLDQFGGSTVAGWTDQATGYYHTATHNGHWYLISPMGNPLFYLGMTAIPSYATPITGREAMFQLPPQSGTFADAYSLNANNDPQNTTYFSFSVANQIRKYGNSSKDVKNAHLRQRLASWGFLGGGKFGDFPSAMPYTPILAHGGAAGVPNAVPGGHPDVFDPNVVSMLKASLAKEMGADITNPFVLGWSVGNEKDEIITKEEVQAILGLGAASPAKRALVDRALSTIYGGSVSAMTMPWKINASTVADVYASKPSPPAGDVEKLRLFYEQNYYSTNYQTVKTLDPNHLYFGSWILGNDSVDWSTAAANCDVVGFDDFTPGPLGTDVQALFAGTKKPVLLGAWGVPSDYGGTRGFGWNQYTMTLSDSASGDAYIEEMQSVAANPYVVGAMLFDYFDEPLSGRGNSDGTGNISAKLLVIGEDFAFGMVDVADTPKYDLVNKVRAANLGALFSLGLLAPPVSCTYSLSSGGQGFLSSGGTGTIVVTADPGCPWSLGPLPSWITLTSPSSGVGPGTVTFTVAPNAGNDQNATLSIGGTQFAIEQEASRIAGLNFIGSMPHLAAEGGWLTTFTFVNKGAAAAIARASLLSPSGSPLTLPVNLPQRPLAGPILAASLDRTIAPNASLVMQATGPANVVYQEGSAQLAATGNVDGFAIFHFNTSQQEAVVPLETRNAATYVLAFDNTNSVLTGVALGNVSPNAATIAVIMRDDTGAMLGTGSIALDGAGHKSFVLSTQFPQTANKRGTIEFDTPSGGQISALGIRNTPPGTLTTIPVLANVGTSGGAMAHLAVNSGWQTTFVLVNAGAKPASATLKFFDNNGSPLSLPLTFPQGAAGQTGSTLTQTIAPGASLWVQSIGADPAASALQEGSAQLTATGNVGGFVIFRYNTSGQEAVVPLESRGAGSYLIAFDNTAGTATGIAMSNASPQAVNVGVTLRDGSGNTLGTGSLALAANAHQSFVLATQFPRTAGTLGTAEFSAPSGASISVLGIRSPPAQTFTTLPALAK